MMWAERLETVQKALKEAQLSGWLFYDFRRTNTLACEFLCISQDIFLTRRFFYWVPSSGCPIKIVHRIEPQVLKHLPGEVREYSTWQELEEAVRQLLADQQTVAMEYSPMNALPYVSKVDAGTMDLVRSCGVEVVSSADLLQLYTSRLSDAQIETHLKAADVVDGAVASAWKLIERSLQDGHPLSEVDVQKYIMDYFAKEKCITDGAPIVAVNEHAADPHYAPSEESSPTYIKRGDFILIDLWCKLNQPEAVFADITRMGVAAAEPTAEQQKVFDTVKSARDAAFQLVQSRFAAGEPVYGYEVDRCARDVIEAAGYGQYFTHRTGHNIAVEEHGPGTHMDDLETHDTRQIQTRTCFSIEPGIYISGNLGVRMEYDVLVSEDGNVQITGGEQTELVCLAVDKESIER